MPKVDLKISSTAAVRGTKLTTTISDVNPEASNNVLKEFAQKLNSFTTNTYGEANRVETVNVDTDDSRKQFRHITVTNTSPNATATITFNKTATETVSPVIFFYTANEVQYLSKTEETSADPTVAKFTTQLPNTTGTLYVGISEKDDFYSALSRIVVQ